MIKIYIKKGEFKNFFLEVFYVATWFFTRVLLRLFYGLKVYGVENIPNKGAYIFAANHRSIVDPPAIGSSVTRVLHFFAKAELFKPPLSFFIKNLNAFPVRRGEVDKNALKKSIDLLINGSCVLMFIEGTRQKSDHFGTPKRGIGYLVNKTGCGVIPVYIAGSIKFPKLTKLTVIFGKPIFFDKKIKDMDIALGVMDEIKKLSQFSS
ncbi:MAG: 1-acyl-sn-glycerol-3-phosphate acyltransferase [bacterium]|nr:1-acyl-sn-glycerol-3-phosphate acyltransferase [bacterium]